MYISWRIINNRLDNNSHVRLLNFRIVIRLYMVFELLLFSSSLFQALKENDLNLGPLLTYEKFGCPSAFWKVALVRNKSEEERYRCRIFKFGKRGTLLLILHLSYCFTLGKIWVWTTLKAQYSLRMVSLMISVTWNLFLNMSTSLPLNSLLKSLDTTTSDMAHVLALLLRPPRFYD